MFEEQSLFQYLQSSGIQCFDLQRLTKDLLIVLNKYKLSCYVNQTTKTVMCCGNLTIENNSLKYYFPIFIDIPLNYPNLLPYIKTTLQIPPVSFIIEQNGVINYMNSISNNQITLETILDSISNQLNTFNLQQLPFKPKTPKPQIQNQPTQFNTQTNFIQSNVMEPPQSIKTNENNFMVQPPPNNNFNGSINNSKNTIPSHQKPNSNTQVFIKPLDEKSLGINKNPQPQVQFDFIQPPKYEEQKLNKNNDKTYHSNLVRRKIPKEIIIDKHSNIPFNNIDAYLDKIDYENMINNLNDLLKNKTISQDEYNQLIKQSNVQIKKLPPPPKQHEELLNFYRMGIITRQEVKANLPSDNGKEEIRIANFSELDKHQQLLVDQFMRKDIDEEELMRLNKDYIEYCKNNPYQ